ncbi:IS110 family transposase, partial [Rhizobium ruizarguesonis]
GGTNHRRSLSASGQHSITSRQPVRRGAITKAGNGRVRHMLVESAWNYRHPPKVGARKLYRMEQAPPKVREIAWKAQNRLT